MAEFSLVCTSASICCGQGCTQGAAWNSRHKLGHHYLEAAAVVLKVVVFHPMPDNIAHAFRPVIWQEEISLVLKSSLLRSLS